MIQAYWIFLSFREVFLQWFLPGTEESQWELLGINRSFCSMINRLRNVQEMKQMADSASTRIPFFQTFREEHTHTEFIFHHADSVY